MSSTDSPAPVTPRKNVRDLKPSSVLSTYNAGIDSYNVLATELKSVRTDITEKLEPLGEKVDRILEVTEGLVEFVNGNCKTLERVLDQAKAGVSSGPVSLADVGQVLIAAIREEGLQTRYVIHRENAETRSFIEHVCVCFLMFITVLFMLNYFHAPWTPVCAMVPPVPPVFESSPLVWNPYFDCITKFFAREFDKNTRDEWAH